MGSSPTGGSSFFLGKVTALGVLCCFALLFVLPCLLFSSFLLSSLIKTCMYMYVPSGPPVPVSNNDGGTIYEARIEDGKLFYENRWCVVL